MHVKFLDMLHFAIPNQFAEAYRNLQDINRRHVYVHEPLIYDAVWLAATALHYSEVILGFPQFNSTHNTTSKIPLVEAALQYVLETYPHFYTGLTVSLMYHVHDAHTRTHNDTHICTHNDTHAHGSNMCMSVFNMELLVSPC